ncbi:MAG: succinyl-diaminopimelate desuccinylase [Candidatus Ancillula sp.]|jgi:succinyl-diaminopimelate desuccinylase|nr:succinyl-diaminopimelate desuccinylase [Candidatus Ancillula sp.]
MWYNGGMDEELTSILMNICDIYSVSGDEKNLADYVEGCLSKISHLEVARIKNNVVAKTNFKHAKRIILAGHIDTVPVSKITDNLPTRRIFENAEQVIYGRGTVDMKAGDAVFLYLAQNLDALSEQLKYDITFIFYEGEEIASEFNGLKYITENHADLVHADFAILGEPTGGGVEAGCNGSLRFDIVLRGKAAHSARAWKGENAIHKLYPVLEILNNWNNTEPKEHAVIVDELEYREGLNAVLISGGVASNIIPDVCKIHINYRFAPNKNAIEAQEIMQNLFRNYELEYSDVSDGARPGLNLESVQKFANYAQEQTGINPRAKMGWTDVARFSALGMPALNFGPGDPMLCHHDDEKIAVRDISKCYEVLVGFLTS